MNRSSRHRHPRPRRLGAAPLAVIAVVLAGVIGWSRPADATWSIVAVDPDTGLVGAAMASCISAGVLGDPGQALVPVVLVPGRAAAVTQGTIDPMAPPEMRAALTSGAGAEEMVAILSADDDQLIVRQYGAAVIEDLESGREPDPVAAFSGEAVEGAVGIRTSATSGLSGRERVAVVGALLADDGAVDRVFESYEAARAAGRSLDRALADALLAGSEAGGDRRCPDDQTALFAHLAVAEADDDPALPSLVVTVLVDEGDGQNPVALLDTFLDEGRTGWIDVGLADDPIGLSRVLVLVVATLLAIAAFVVIRRGLGHTSARR